MLDVTGVSNWCESNRCHSGVFDLHYGVDNGCFDHL